MATRTSFNRMITVLSQKEVIKDSLEGFSIFSCGLATLGEAPES